MEASAERRKSKCYPLRIYDTHADHIQTHPLLCENDDVSIDGDGPDDIRLRAAITVDASVLDAPNAELSPIFEQLRRSLENMQGNHALVEGIDEAMAHAQTALDDVLFGHASAQQYAAL